MMSAVWEIKLRVPGMPVDMELIARVPAYNATLARASVEVLIPNVHFIGEPVGLMPMLRQMQEEGLIND